MERIVSRAELSPPKFSPPSSPDLAQIQHIQEFEFVHHEALPDANDDDPIEGNDEDGFAFHLFAPSTENTTTGSRAAAVAPSKIRLDSPDRGSDAEPGLLEPHRDSRYYFTASSPRLEQQREEFRAAAVSGEDILAWSTTTTTSCGPAPGLAYAWKVLHVPATKRQRDVLRASDAMFAQQLVVKDGMMTSPARTPRRSRLGKKARIAGRAKVRLTRALQEAEQKVAEAKEVQEREKRVRRNREKKLKKKGKAKAAKKAEVASGQNV
jgi:hypothetical protein